MEGAEAVVTRADWPKARSKRLFVLAKPQGLSSWPGRGLFACGATFRAKSTLLRKWSNGVGYDAMRI